MMQSTFLYAVTSFYQLPFSASVSRILTAGKCCFPRKMLDVDEERKHQPHHLNSY